MARRKRKRQNKPRAYPDDFDTEEDQEEYDSFIAGLPMVNQIWLEHNLEQVKGWIANGCPSEQWAAVKKALRDVSFSFSTDPDFSPIKDTTIKQLGEESGREAPNTEAIRKSWDEMLAFASAA